MSETKSSDAHTDAETNPISTGAPRTLYITTLLVNNIHCPSCVTYIEDVLRPETDVCKIDVSIMDQTIRIEHTGSLTTPGDIAGELIKAAFEVEHMTTSDVDGNQVGDVDFVRGQPQPWLTWPHTPSRSQQKHMDNCKSCQDTLTTSKMTSKRSWRSEPSERHFRTDSSSRPLKPTNDVPITSSVEDGPVVINVDGTDEGFGAEKSDEKGVYRLSLSIEGMTCGTCVGTITRGVQELPFVTTVNVDLVSNSATVMYTGNHKQEVLDKVDDLGFEATVIDLQAQGDSAKQGEKGLQQRQVWIQVNGMFCDHCPMNVVSALTRAFGQSVTITTQPTMKDPRLNIQYTPSPPDFTIRQFIAVINASHEAFSASVYHPPTSEERSKAIRHREQMRILMRLLFTAIVAIPTFIIGVVFMSLVPESNRTRRWFEQPIWAGIATREEWALFLMTTPVMFFGADTFHTKAMKEITSLWRRGSKIPILRRFYRFGSMNLLVSAGTSVAYFSSVAVLIMDALSKEDSTGRASSTYFDSVTFLTFFILIGRFLEAYSKAKTGDAVALLSNLRPAEALLVEESGDEKTTEKVSVDLLEVGDKVVVPHGTSPPTDGQVSEVAQFLFDESSLTGESRPVKKTLADKLFVGTVNVSGPCPMEVTDIGGTSMLDQIVAVVREGQGKRAPIERIADIITGYFVPVITLVAILTWVIWLALGESGVLPHKWLDVNQGGWSFWSLEFAIAVFVVACPCGIGLAAPTALYVGGGLAAKNHILVQGGGEAFQEASRIDVMVFDKTGTLTEGNMKVTKTEWLRPEPADHAIPFALAKALEEASTHPIAAAINEYCAQQLAHLPAVRIKHAEITEIPGQGMLGIFTLQHATPDVSADGFDLTYLAAIGNRKLYDSCHQDPRVFDYLEPTLGKYHTTAHSTAIFGLVQISDPVHPARWQQVNNLQPRLVFAISDPLRRTTAHVIQTLQDVHGVEVHMCTGDNQTTALAIASTVGIPVTNFAAGMLPESKASYVKSLKVNPKNPTGPGRIVAFVGDGTNDTPALAAADVSIALSSGSDVAVGTASFILLNSDLEGILALVKLAKRVFRRVKLNFLWAGVYNIVLVPVAAGIFYPLGRWRLGPVWASAAMAASSVSVVTSSLALRWAGGL